MAHLQFGRFMGSASRINVLAFLGDYGGSPALCSHAQLGEVFSAIVQ